jgi:hypothetical protein
MFAEHALLAWLAALLAATLGFLRSRYEMEARHLATIGALATIPAVLIAGVYYYANQGVVQILLHQEVITCTGPQLQPPRDACELANFTSKVLKLYGISALVGIALLWAAGFALGAALRGSEGLQNWGRARIFGLGTASVLFAIGLVSLWLLPGAFVTPRPLPPTGHVLLRDLGLAQIRNAYPYANSPFCAELAPSGTIIAQVECANGGYDVSFATWSSLSEMQARSTELAQQHSLAETSWKNGIYLQYVANEEPFYYFTREDKLISIMATSTSVDLAHLRQWVDSGVLDRQAS